MPISQYNVGYQSVSTGSEGWLEFYDFTTPNGAVEFRWQFRGADFRTPNQNDVLTSFFSAQWVDYDYGGSGPGHHRLWLFYYSAINGGGGNDTITGFDTTVVSDIQNAFAKLGASADLAGLNLYATAADLLLGGPGDDKIYGLGGDDTLEGDSGNDFIDGGTGTDTAIYGGKRSDYLFTKLASGFQIQDLRSGTPDGTDTVINVEKFQFSDGVVFAPGPITWAAGVTGSFETATRWSPAQVPGSLDDVFITAAKTEGGDHYYAKVTSDETIASLTIGSTGGLDIVGLQNTVTVLKNLTNAGDIEASSGNFTVNGFTQNTGKIDTHSGETATFNGNVLGGGTLTQTLGGTIHVVGNTDNFLEISGTISVDGAASGNVSFHNGGTLRIGGTSMPTGEIKFFNSSDQIDLAGVPYDPNGTATIAVNNGYHLSIKENGQQYQLNFDSLAFSSSGTSAMLSADGHGGTLVTVSTKTGVQRFFDAATGDHFYTLSTAEAAQIRATLPTYHDEGAPWSAPDKGANTIDVFRFFDVATNTHFLTSSVAERDQILATLPSYHFEGVAFEAYDRSGTGTLTLERFFNTSSHLHTYAASAAEITSILNGGAGPGWVDEGPSFIVHA